MIECVVSEVFGPTVQGEGPSAGRRCSFVRLGRCNLDCQWCDTPYTWDWSRFSAADELHKRTVTDLLIELEPHDTDLLIITGGEPMLQPRAVVGLLDEGWFQRVEVETNGTRPVNREVSLRVGPTVKELWFNVSPKLESSGVDNKLRKLHPDYAGLVHSGHAIMKFVITHDHLDDDLAEVDAIVAQHIVDIDKVWLMPEATNQWQLTSRLATVTAAALARGYNVSSRLHVAAWGNQRGV